MTDRPKILLVDDDPAIRASLSFSLELEGFAVETFESAEALAEAGPAPAGACLVVDYRLPGLDGLSLLERMRRRGVATPAVLITSTPTRALRARAAAAGAALVEKPLLSDALTAAIRAQAA